MTKLLSKIVDAKPDEFRALGLAFVFNFVVLGSYYVIRPIRDNIGAEGGLENLPWMYMGTLVGMLIANALFSAIVACMSRRRFIPIAYRFFIANLILFYLLMRTSNAAQNIWVGRAFFVWVSVFNLFVVTVFWAFMTDVFNTDQGKRLFGAISVGGTLGAIVGAKITELFIWKIGAANLLLITVGTLEAGAWCVKFFPADFKGTRTTSGDKTGAKELTDAEVLQQPPADLKRNSESEKPIGGNLWAGITHVARSPYLLGICAFMLLHAITSTLVYFQQADITGHGFHDRDARIAFFAQIDRWVNVLTIGVQIFLTGRLLKWFGVGLTLAFLPVLSMMGFIAMGFMPVLA